MPGRGPTPLWLCCEDTDDIDSDEAFDDTDDADEYEDTDDVDEYEDGVDGCERDCAELPEPEREWGGVPWLELGGDMPRGMWLRGFVYIRCGCGRCGVLLGPGPPGRGPRRWEFGAAPGCDMPPALPPPRGPTNCCGPPPPPGDFCGSCCLCGEEPPFMCIGPRGPPRGSWKGGRPTTNNHGKEVKRCA